MLSHVQVVVSAKGYFFCTPAQPVVRLHNTSVVGKPCAVPVLEYWVQLPYRI